MSVAADSVRTARHLARYQTLCAQQRHGDGKSRANVMRAALRYGAPALAPLIALLGVGLGRDGPDYAVSVALLVTVASAYTRGRPKLRAFDLLHHPSRRGLVIGWLLHALPWLLWCGVCTALALALVAGVPEGLAGRGTIAVALLVPLVAALRGGARRVAARSNTSDVGRYVPIIAFVVTASVARYWLADRASLLVGVAAALIGFGVMGRAGVAALRELAFSGVGLGVILLPSAPEFLHRIAAGDARANGVAALMLVAALGLCVSELWEQLRDIGAAEVVRSFGEDADTPLDRGAEQPSLPLRRSRSGRGFAAARASYMREEWFPAARPTDTWRDRIGVWTTALLVVSFALLRGPLLAVAAVVGSGASAGGVLVGVALASAFWATRLGSFDGLKLDERAWLLGVDYREQVLHGLRSLLLVGALPTVCAAALALLVTGPTDPDRQAAVVLIASAFVLRAGAVGYWPLREIQRVRPALLLTGLALAAFVYEPAWSGSVLVYALWGCAALGIVGLLLRLARLREPQLRDSVRED